MVVVAVLVLMIVVLERLDFLEFEQLREYDHIGDLDPAKIVLEAFSYLTIFSRVVYEHLPK